LLDDRAKSGNVLCWNGEVFGGLPVPDGTNDTAVLLASLTNDTATPSLSSSARTNPTRDAVMKIMESIEGNGAPRATDSFETE
jgi:hypothetical protein